ncbi:hypothetical protein ACKI16_24270 [Streptomyces scabiei]|uniref:hypothetical protein n=1 Tax=Streptomyces scabiei TaxID=1930 RepID=UPI0038F60323
MTDRTTESPHDAWLPEAHRTAQTSAMVWAQRADEAYEQGVHHEDRANSWTPNTAHAEVIAHERDQAQQCRASSAEAVRLAEMWARVAAVLIPPLEPIECELRSTDA